jgi:hypothetical protein
VSLRVLDVIQFLVENGPGRTQAELSQATYGDDGYQQRVTVACNILSSTGRVERRGKGGRKSPYTWHPRKTDANVRGNKGSGAGESRADASDASARGT